MQRPLRRFAIAECTHTAEGRCENTTCRYSLISDWAPRRGWQLAQPMPPDAPTCALEVAGAEPDGLSLDSVGALLGCSRQRIEQLERRALAKVQRATRRAPGVWADFAPVARLRR